LTGISNYTSGSKKITKMTKITLRALPKLFEEVKKELFLVTWPKKNDLVLSVIVVGIAVLVSGAVFFTLDYFLHKVVQFIIKL
jgi:preprotein translocase SecE subunit